VTYVFLHNSHEVLHLGSGKSYDYYRRHVFLLLTILVFSFFLLPLFVPSHLDLFLPYFFLFLFFLVFLSIT